MNFITSQLGRKLAMMTLIAVAFARPATAQFDPTDESIHEVFRQNQIIERLNEQLPLDLKFTDSAGNSVKLGDYFDGKRPVILALVYFRCPMLCGLVTQGMVQGAKELSWTPGDQYRIVVVSFNHNEGPELADLNRRAFLAELNRPGVEKGVAFLTGNQQNIRELAAHVGFPFAWSEETKRFTHPSAIYAVTPVGHMSRYLHGVNYPEKNLRLSLVEASAGKVGSFADRVVLLCSHFDADQRGYVTSAMKVMNFSAITLGAGALGVLFALIIYRRTLRRGGSKKLNSNSTPAVNA